MSSDATTEETTGSMEMDPASFSITNAFPEVVKPLKEGAVALSAAIAATATAELDATTEDLEVLASAADDLAGKYEESRTMLQTSVEKFAGELVGTHKAIAPLLKQIDDIDTGVTELEALVNHLNSHTKHLAKEFRDLYGL